MYDDMIETTEYKSFELSLEKFNDKMNVTTIPTFTSKNDAMAWINNNLPNTNFSSINEFESDFDNITGAVGNIMYANMGLFNHLSNANGGQIIQIFEPKIPGVEYPTEPNDCQLDCIVSFDNSRAAAQTAHDAAVAAISFNGDDFQKIMALVKLTALEKDYKDLLNSLYYAFNTCIEGCGG